MKDHAGVLEAFAQLASDVAGPVVDAVARAELVLAGPEVRGVSDDPEGPVLARRVDLGFVGPGGFYTDSAYDMALEPKLQNIPHTAATLVIELTVEGEGTQSLDDESWAVDELRVTTAE